MPALDLISTRYREGNQHCDSKRDVSPWNRSPTQRCVVSRPLTARSRERHAVLSIEGRSCRTTSGVVDDHAVVLGHPSAR
jgi:hypothetical protein